MQALKMGGYTFAAIMVLTFGFIISNVVTYHILSTAPQENTSRLLHTVKAVCDYSRDIHSTYAEEQCGVAQDESQTEYICPAYTAPTTQCTVEDKR